MAARVISVKIKGEDKLKENIAYLRANFPEWLNEANAATADEIANEARRNVKGIDAFDTGELYGSIKTSISARGLAVVVYSDVKQAAFIEFGTAPHFPPLAAIAAWCRRKGIPESAAFPIARAISERGTPERPWLYPAYVVGMRGHVGRVRQYVLSALGRVLTG